MYITTLLINNYMITIENIYGLAVLASESTCST